MCKVDCTIDHENYSHDSSTDDERLATAETACEDENKESTSNDLDGAENASEEEIRVGAASCHEFEISAKLMSTN
jgi:hypothetical protein